MKNIPPIEHRFKPGQSGNKAGRPKGRGITDRLKAVLDETDDDGRTVAERIVQAGVDAALAGDFRFWQEILNRMDGKVQDEVSVEGKVVQFIIHREPSDRD